MKYVPTTLSDNPEFVQSEITRFSQFDPKPERFQLDILDGQFADNITVEPGIVHALDMHGMNLDIHFMVVEPLEWLREIKECASIDIVIAQIEKMTSIEAFVDEVTMELGYRAGLAIDMYTPFEAIPEDVLSQVAVIQVMANSAGYQGQDFKPQALEVISNAARAKAENGYRYDISVDIGMDAETIPQVEEAGATMVAIGSYLQGEDAEEHWKQLTSV